MEHWTVPGYAHTRELGVRDSGRTVLATHTATGVPVVIKYLASELSGDDAYLNRYRSEARRLVNLNSPHVATLYEYVEADQGVATVREYVDGASLRALLAADGALAPEAALTVLKGGLLALAAGAEVGARHGDYRAEQVLVDLDGQIRVSDFGADTSPPQPSPGPPSGDTSAAVATFVECLTGSTEVAGSPAQSVPKGLRVLLPVLADPDREVLARELQAVATGAYGDGWEARGRRRLARSAARCARRAARRGRA